MSLPWTIAASIWFFLPAMLPNTSAAILGGGHPVDFGRMLHGKRILGDGKTWRGLAIGTLSGVVLGYLEALLSSAFIPELSSVYELTLASLPTLLSLSFGSMAGDMVGAFIKRRLGIQRGSPVPVLDQYDFVAGALLVCFLASRAAEMIYLFRGDAVLGFVVLLIIIYPLHRLVNYLGYRKGLKAVPW